MLFEPIAELVAERTDCDISEVKMESTFHELGIQYPVLQVGITGTLASGLAPSKQMEREIREFCNSRLAI